MQTYVKYLLLSFIFLLTSNSFAQKSSEKFIVVLDAGHGGRDPGRPTKFDTEKAIALKIVLKIGNELEKHKDIEVIYTRKSDVFIELRERAKIANKADADLFVSVHCNAHHTQAYGTETYVLSLSNTGRNFDIAKAENEVIFLEDDYEKHYEGYDPNSPESLIGLTLMQEDYVDQSILLASSIENNFKNKLKRSSRGVKQISLWVMHNTYMPSVLIETGFLTNKIEGAYLSSKKGQTEMATSIKDAILKYKGKLNFESIGDIVINDNEDYDASIDKPTTYPEITFKVQIAASSRKLMPKPYNFKGLNEISRSKTDETYKYFYGETSDYSQIKKYQTKAHKKGYDTSFIVAFKNGLPITINEALKTPSN
ncbi:MAG: N-acetylmuramoyl-L-alanine amidase [Bacteroidetes bacterium]|nr:N-acetylmuramoyl-L-alanine amidase [Bacteroidota bacterium]